MYKSNARTHICIGIALAILFCFYIAIYITYHHLRPSIDLIYFAASPIDKHEFQYGIFDLRWKHDKGNNETCLEPEKDAFAEGFRNITQTFGALMNLKPEGDGNHNTLAVIWCGMDPEKGKCRVHNGKSFDGNISITLDKPRIGAASAFSLNGSRWIVSGGRINSKIANSTIQFDNRTRKFSAMPAAQLPRPLAHHCHLLLSSNRAFVGGSGITADENHVESPNNRSWIYDSNKKGSKWEEVTNEDEKTKCPPDYKLNVQCGLLRDYEGDAKVFVVKFNKTSRDKPWKKDNEKPYGANFCMEIFDVGKKTWEMRSSENRRQITPHGAMVGINGALVMKGNNNGTSSSKATEMYYIGGEGYSVKHKNLAKIVWEINWKGYWKQKSEYLKYPFQSGFALQVPEDMNSCH